MTGILAKYFGWSYSRVIQVILKHQRETNSLESKLLSRNYTNSQFVGKLRKQMTQNNKKRYLKRITTLEPDHDIDMEGTLLHFQHSGRIWPRLAITPELPNGPIIFYILVIVHKYANCNSNPVSRVYVWGLACYGALGNPDLILPKKTRKNTSDTMHKPIRYS